MSDNRGTLSAGLRAEHLNCIYHLKRKIERRNSLFLGCSHEEGRDGTLLLLSAYEYDVGSRFPSEDALNLVNANSKHILVLNARLCRNNRQLIIANCIMSEDSSFFFYLLLYLLLFLETIESIV